MNQLTLKTEGELSVVGIRRFAAPPEAVYRAFTEAELIQKWMLGPDGWTMPVCICDARPGGQIRYEWSDGNGKEFYSTGEFIELVPFRKIVQVGRMHFPETTPDNHTETTPDNHTETTFEPDGEVGEGTLMTIRMTLPDAETRAAMLASCMNDGMEAGYARLASMIDVWAKVPS